MFQIEVNSRTPIYEQIKEQTSLMVLKGLLTVGDKLPSVRSLSVKLSVNPNTIQRAYSDMCNNGLLYSMPGKGFFISDKALSETKSKAAQNLNSFAENVKLLKLSGIEKKTLTEIINTTYESGEKND